MRLEDWTEDVIHFQKSAAEYTGYFEALAQAVCPHLSGRRRLCDAGCGMGYLGAALARDFDVVDALDRNPRAIAAARSVAAERGLSNMHARVADVMAPLASSERGEKPYDAMVLCAVAPLEEALRAAVRRCEGTVVVINRFDPAPSTLAEWQRAEREPLRGRNHLKGEDYLILQEALRLRGIPFHAEVLDLEFGQPLADLDEARRFFGLYRTLDFPDGVSDEALTSQLDRGRVPWRYYLPKRRQMGMFAIETKHLRGLFSEEEAACEAASHEGRVVPCR